MITVYPKQFKYLTAYPKNYPNSYSTPYVIAKKDVQLLAKKKLKAVTITGCYYDRKTITKDIGSPGNEKLKELSAFLLKNLPKIK